MKMKMVKKLVAMALVSTMTLSGLAACGGETADTNKDTSKDTAKEDKSEGKEVLKCCCNLVPDFFSVTAFESS